MFIKVAKLVRQVMNERFYTTQNTDKISIVITLSIQCFIQAILLTNKTKNFLIRIKLELIIALIVAKYSK